MLINHRLKIRSRYPPAPLVVRIGHNPKLLEKYDRASLAALQRLYSNPITPKFIGGFND